MTASYVVEVNECAIFASTLGSQWWTTNVLMRPIAARINWAATGPAGGIARISCADREEAQFIRDHMVSNGIHAKHVTVKRVPAGAP